MAKETKSGKKIVHILPTLIQGGVSRLIVDYLNSTQHCSEEHILIKMFAEHDFFDDDLQVSHSDLGASRANSLMYFWSLFLAFIKFNYFLLKEKPDVVVGWHYYGGLFACFAKLFGCRVVWSIHATSMDQNSKKLISRISQWVTQKLAFICVDKVHFCSSAGYSLHQNYGWPEQKMCVIDNGIDTKAFSPMDLDRKGFALFSEREGPVFVCVGRYDAQKDHQNLFKALSELKESRDDFTCYLIGKDCGTENRELLSLVSSYGLEETVRLLGQRKDLPEIYNCADLKILSSSFGESMPLVVLEAVSCGTPVVATDVGSTKEITKDFGVIVPPKDSHALCLGIVQALADVKLQRHVADDGHDYISQNYGLAKMSEQYTDLFCGRGKFS